MDGAVGRGDTQGASKGGRVTDVAVSIRLCLRLAAGFLVLIVAIHLLKVFTFYGLGINRFGIILARFDLNGEGVVPSWFASLVLMASGVLAFAIAAMKARLRDRYRAHWLGVGWIFVFLSMDEAAGLHEMWMHYLEPLTDWSGLFFYESAVPNLVLAAIVGLAMLPFVLTLGLGTQVRLAISAGLYVAGAVGVEMLGGAQHSAAGIENLRYQLLVTAEETLEMIGALGFVSAFLHYLLGWQDRPRLVLAP